MAEPVQNIHLDGNLLLINHSSATRTRITSLNRTSRSVISTLTDSGSFYSSVMDRNRNLLVGSSHYIPADIVSVKYKDDGTFERLVRSAHHGDFPIGDEHWISPDGTRVVLGSGAIYDAATRTRISAFLPNAITDADWMSDHLVTIRTTGQATQAQSWHRNSFLPDGVAWFSGRAKQLKPLADGRLLLITINDDGIPEFRLLNEQLREDTAAGLSISMNREGLLIAENNGSGQFTVTLNSKPITEVIVQTTLSQLGQVEILNGTLRFTPND